MLAGLRSRWITPFACACSRASASCSTRSRISSLGRGAAVALQAARYYDAGLIVLGGKHHSGLGRWMGGSTAHHVVRTTDIPLLVTGSKPGPVGRILVAADLSYAVRPTFEAAARLARLFGAELRVLHAVEPLPVFAEMPMVLDDAAFYADSRQQFERCIEPLLENVPAQGLLRRGHAADALAAEAAEWGADIVAVGAHGKGWMDRLLMGSTTERLLDQLPTSLLVIPVPPPAGERRPGRAVRRARRAPRRAAGGTVRQPCGTWGWEGRTSVTMSGHPGRRRAASASSGVWQGATSEPRRRCSASRDTKTVP